MTMMLSLGISRLFYFPLQDGDEWGKVEKLLQIKDVLQLLLIPYF